MAAPTREVQLSFPAPGIYIPSEITCKIVCLLKRSELFVMMEVCKQWWVAAQDPLFWRTEIQILGLKEPSWDVINGAVKSLLQMDIKTYPLLSIKVKTAQEFDAMMMPVVFNDAEPTQEDQEISENYGNELGEKFELYDAILKGFWAVLPLYKLGLRTLTQVEAYALCLEKKYGQDKYWVTIAKTLIGQGKIDEALACMKNHVKELDQKAAVICQVVYVRSKEHSPKECFEWLQKYVKENEKYKPHFDECINYLLECALKQKDLQALEMGIDLLVHASEKIMNVISLINSYYAKQESSEVERLLDKYEAVLEGAKNIMAMQVVDCYVNIGRYVLARHFALSHRKTSDNMSLYTLRNTLKSCQGPAEELAKAEAFVAELDAE